MTTHDHLDDVLLCAACSDQHLVTTSSGSIYLIDLDAGLITRVPDPDRVATFFVLGGRRPGRREFVGLTDVPEPVVDALASPDGPRPATALRADAEAVPLLGMEPVRVGHPAAFALDILGVNGVVTTRRTTPVVEVRRVAR